MLFSPPKLEQSQRLSLLIVGLDQQSLYHFVDGLHRFPVQLKAVADREEGVAGPLMPELQWLVFVVLPEHVEDPLGLHEKFRGLVHEDLLHFAHPSGNVVFRNPLVGVFLSLLILRGRLFEIVKQAILRKLDLLFLRNSLPVQHHKHKILDVLEALGGEVVEQLADVAVGAPHEHDPIIDELISQLEPCLNYACLTNYWKSVVCQSTSRRMPWKLLPHPD